MGSITRLKNKVKSIDFDQIILESIVENQKPLVFLQKEQMIKGLRSTGRRIGRYKNKTYSSQKYKQSRRAGFGFVDLWLTGSFQGDIYIIMRKKSLVFTSGDPKTSSLVKKYGKDIFGLTKQNTADYSKRYLSPVAVKKVKKYILS
jgi:hypothetical protein